MISKKEIDKEKMDEILKKSKEGEIPLPKEGFLCPQCNQKLKIRYFKEVWRINGRFVICYKFFECSACGYQYAKRVSP